MCGPDDPIMALDERGPARRATRRREPPPGRAAVGSAGQRSAARVRPDLEMTGLDVSVDRVVEVCVDRVVGGKSVARVHSLVRPESRVGGAAHVHGLDEAALARGAALRGDRQDDVLRGRSTARRWSRTRPSGT